METARWKAVESLYHAVLTVEPGRRSAFLESACADDAELRREVESLIGFARNSAATIPLTLASGTLLSERFLVIRRIGAGGMGDVYEATDFELGDQIALKVIRPQLIQQPEMLARFRREVQSAKKIAHPNICRVHDLHRHAPNGESGQEIVFLTMELLLGETLRARLGRGPLLLDETGSIVRQLTEALEAAHKSGVVHCDFKTENVMLASMPDGSSRVVVTDFGLARSIVAEDGSTPVTRTDQLIGTPAYLAPEQLLGEPITRAVDIYALGVVLYEMVTGTQPFTGDSAFAVAAQRLAAPPAPPSTRVPGLSAEWDAAILKCLEYYPAKRFSSALDLWKVLSGELPVPVHAPKRLSRFGMLAGIAALLICAVSTPMVERLVNHRVSPGGASAVGTYLAVLPFRTVASDETLRYRADGIADELTVRLFQFPDLHLASRTAVDNVKDRPAAQAARMLGATMLVQGSLESAGTTGMLRAIVSLEDVSQQRLIWTEQFTGSVRDLLGLEDQIAARLIRALNVSPTAEQMARASTHVTENPEAYDLYLKGRSLVKDKRDQKNVQTAIGIYNTAISRDPHFGLAYAGLADACTYMYDLNKDGVWLDKAQHEAAEAVRWSPDEPASHTAMGSAYLATGRTNEAITELRRALELAPRSDEANRRLGSAYRDAGNKEQALHYYQKAIAANPYYWYNHSQLGWAYLTFGRYEEALESYLKVTQMAPELSTGYNNLAAVYMFKGQYQNAIEPLTQAIKLHSTASAYTNLASCYYGIGQYERAAESGEKAVGMSPTNDLPAGNLGDAYRQLGNAGKARACYQKAIALAYASLEANPRQASTLSRLAQYYAKQHQFAPARQFMQRARSIDPNDPDLLFEAAVIESLANNQRNAIRDLDLAVRNGYVVARIESEPDLTELRRTAAYRESLAVWRERSK